MELKDYTEELYKYASELGYLEKVALSQGLVHRALKKRTANATEEALKHQRTFSMGSRRNARKYDPATVDLLDTKIDKARASILNAAGGMPVRSEFNDPIREDPSNVTAQRISFNGPKGKKGAMKLERYRSYLGSDLVPLEGLNIPNRPGDPRILIDKNTVGY